MNELILKQEIDKINTLSLFTEEKRELLKSAAKYTTIPYMPMEVEFIERHVLNDTEYPLVESKLSQAAIELKARINRLVDAQFNVNKLKLEIEELKLDIEDIKNSQSLSIERINIQVKKKELEIQQKNWMIIGHMNESETNYQEFTQWNITIEDCIKVIKENDPTITDFNQIAYDKIRINEMKIKIARWKELQKRGADLTPSQKALIG